MLVLYVMYLLVSRTTLSATCVLRLVWLL